MNIVLFSFLVVISAQPSPKTLSKEQIHRNIPDIGNGTLPQFVVLTFDDAVNNELWDYIYKNLFDDLTDTHTGCQLKATFFVSHNNTDYAKVNALYSNGHEIALHSFSHGGDRRDSEYLVRKFRMGRWELELQHNIKNLIDHAQLPKNMMFGWRSPFLFTGGDESFTALNKTNILYDSSLSFFEKSWPYPVVNTRKSRTCLIKPCPSRRDYVFYEAPLSVWRGADGNPCAMMDACRYGSTREEVYDLMMTNFRKFQKVGVPLPMFLHGAILRNKDMPHFREAFMYFLQTLLDMKDVHFVTMRQLVQFVRTPMDAKTYARGATEVCSTFRPKVKPCVPRNPACEFKTRNGGNSVYLNTCAKKCPVQRLEIVYDFFGKSCC